MRNFSAFNPISRCLHELIEQSGWSVAQVARRANVGQHFIYDVISGKSRNPSVVKLARVADALGVSLDALMKIPEDEAPEPHNNKDEAETPFMPSDQFIKLNEGNKLRPLDNLLQDIFTHAITFCGGNMTRAADGLGMSRSTFYRKLGAHRELLSQKQKNLCVTLTPVQLTKVYNEALLLAALNLRQNADRERDKLPPPSPVTE